MATKNGHTPGAKQAPKRTVNTKTVINEQREIDPDEAESLIAGDSAPEVTNAEAEELEYIDPLDQFATEITGRTGITVNVYKLDSQNSRARSFCCDVDTDEDGSYDTAALMKRLQAEFGGGNFEAIARAPGGTMAKRVRFSVMLPKAANSLMAAPVNESVAQAVAAAMAPMQAIMQQLAANANKPAFNINALAENALKLSPLLALIRDFMRPAGAPAAVAGGMTLESFIAMKKMMDELGMGDRDPPAAAQAMQLFEKFGGPVLEALKQRQPVPGAMPNPRPMQPGMRPAPGMVPTPHSSAVPSFSPPVPTSPEIPTVDIAALVSPYTGVIVQMAQSNMEPEMAADSIIAVMPDTMIDPLCDAIESGALTNALVKHPQLMGFRVWLDKVGAAILVLCESEESEVPSDEDNNSGGGGDVSERGPGAE